MNAPRPQANMQPELFIRRTFDAPRKLVFRMWTVGQHLEKWSCPKGFTIPFSEGDIRPGGSFRICMRAPDGTDHWLGGTYKEIVAPERIVFTHAWQDESGSSEHETVVTVTLSENDGRTLLTLHQAFFPSDAVRDGHMEGWNETFDQLERYLAQ